MVYITLLEPVVPFYDIIIVVWTAETIQGIIGGFLAIGGILLALISSRILGRRLSKRMACIAIGLALSGVGLFILLTSFPEYAIGFSVLATLALAIAAFLTIKAADAREERRRQEELLKEIIEWATELSKFNITPERDLRNSKDIEEMYRWSAPHWANLLSSKESKGESLKRRVGATWPNIGSLIENVLKNIELTVLAIDYPKSSISPDKMLKIIKKLGKCVLELNNSVEKVIEAVDKIKASDIG